MQIDGRPPEILDALDHDVQQLGIGPERGRRFFEMEPS